MRLMCASIVFLLEAEFLGDQWQYWVEDAEPGTSFVPSSGSAD